MSTPREAAGGDPADPVPDRPTGWQLPGTPQEEAATSAPEPDAGREFRPTLSGAVWGQVTEVRESSIQQRDGLSHPIVTVRLERHDAHRGRTAVVIVRLMGGDALGFAHDGDLVEAVGRRKSSSLVATRCVNHTTGAVYDGGTARGIKRLVLLLLAFLVLAGGMLFGVLELAGDAERASRRNFERESQQRGDDAFRDCIERGAPAATCETLR